MHRRVRAWPSADHARMLAKRALSRGASSRATVACKSQSATRAAPASPFDIKDKIRFLREDLDHLFDDRGIDSSAYEPIVDFVDPITKYSSLEGYMKNIGFLKKAFDPKFYLHEIWASSDTAVTTRWTMIMDFTAIRGLPVIGQAWKPTIIFTGTSTYVFNPETGRIYRHIDTWDSINNQKYFSVEAFLDFLGQLFQFHTTPSDLETPEYDVLKRAKDYQIRRYKPYIVVETSMDETSSSNGSSGQANPAGPGTRAFQALAGFIFGKNKQGEVMKMTTPVYSDSTGRMQFVIGPSAHKDLGSLPEPLSPDVSAKTVSPSLCAVRIFTGTSTPEKVEQEHQTLLQSLQRDGLRPAGTDWSLARYNGPGTPGFTRRNEVLVPLDEDVFAKTWPQ